MKVSPESLPARWICTTIVTIPIIITITIFNSNYNYFYYCYYYYYDYDYDYDYDFCYDYDYFYHYYADILAHWVSHSASFSVPTAPQAEVAETRRISSQVRGGRMWTHTLLGLGFRVYGLGGLGFRV